MSDELAWFDELSPEEQQATMECVRLLGDFWAQAIEFYGNFSDTICTDRIGKTPEEVKNGWGHEMMNVGCEIQDAMQDEDDVAVNKGWFLAGILMREIFIKGGTSKSDQAAMMEQIYKNLAIYRQSRSQQASSSRANAQAELLRRHRENPTRTKTSILTSMSRDSHRKFGCLRTLKGYCREITFGPDVEPE